MIKYIESKGWFSIPSKNPYMISFNDDKGDRLNFYFTTNTLTIQSIDRKTNLSYREINTIEKLHEII